MKLASHQFKLQKPSKKNNVASPAEDLPWLKTSIDGQHQNKYNRMLIHKYLYQDQEVTY